MTIDFMGKRHLAWIFSGVVLLGSVFALVVQGVNRGLDFTGGALLVVGFDEAVAARVPGHEKLVDEGPIDTRVIHPIVIGRLLDGIHDLRFQCPGQHVLPGLLVPLLIG